MSLSLLITMIALNTTTLNPDSVSNGIPESCVAVVATESIRQLEERLVRDLSEETYTELIKDFKAIGNKNDPSTNQLRQFLSSAGLNLPDYTNRTNTPITDILEGFGVETSKPAKLVLMNISPLETMIEMSVRQEFVNLFKAGTSFIPFIKKSLSSGNSNANVRLVNFKGQEAILAEFDSKKQSGKESFNVIATVNQSKLQIYFSVQIDESNPKSDVQVKLASYLEEGRTRPLNQVDNWKQVSGVFQRAKIIGYLDFNSVLSYVQDANLGDQMASMIIQQFSTQLAQIQSLGAGLVMDDNELSLEVATAMAGDSKDFKWLKKGLNGKDGFSFIPNNPVIMMRLNVDWAEWWKVILKQLGSNQIMANVLLGFEKSINDQFKVSLTQDLLPSFSGDLNVALLNINPGNKQMPFTLGALMGLKDTAPMQTILDKLPTIRWPNAFKVTKSKLSGVNAIEIKNKSLNLCLGITKNSLIVATSADVFGQMIEANQKKTGFSTSSLAFIKDVSSGVLVDMNRLADLLLQNALQKRVTGSSMRSPMPDPNALGNSKEYKSLLKFKEFAVTTSYSGFLSDIQDDGTLQKMWVGVKGNSTMLTYMIKALEETAAKESKKNRFEPDIVVPPSSDKPITID